MVLKAAARRPVPSHGSWASTQSVSRRVSMAQARRMRHPAATISSTMSNSTASAGWKRSRYSVRVFSKPSCDSPSTTTQRASKAWLRAFCEEICLPDSVTGPRERAPLAREDWIFRSEDIVPDSRIERGVREGGTTFFVFSYLNDERFGDCKRFHQFRGAQISGKKDGADRRESDETVQ